MVDFNSSSSNGKDWNQSNSWSAPLSAKAQGRYWNWLDKKTGGDLNQFALEGTQPVNYGGVANPAQFFSRDVGYRGPSDDQLKALGGLGATRLDMADKQYKKLVDENNADAGMTLAQRQRSNQLVNQDYSSQRDAISKETEAAITQAAFERAAQDMAGRGNQSQLDAELAKFLQGEGDRNYAAELANSQLPMQRFQGLSDIYAKGKGQKQASSATGMGTNSSESTGVGL